MATRIRKRPRRKGQAGVAQRRPPVQRRAKMTVDAILTATAQVFEESGYAAATTNRIAERAGVSIGTLYQYFDDKEALAVALLEVHIEETRRRLLEWVGQMVSEQHTLAASLAGYVRHMLDVHAGRPRLQHILLEETRLPGHVHSLLMEAEHQATRAMAGLLRTFPQVRRPNLEHAAYIVIHTVEPLTHRFSAHPEDTEIQRKELERELVALLLAYLTAGDPVPS